MTARDGSPHRDSATGPSPAEALRPSAWSTLLFVAGGAAVVAYPIIAYLVLDRYGPRALAGVLAVGVVPGLVRRLRRAGAAELLAGPGLLAMVVLVLAGLAFALREAGFALFAPVAMNAGLMVSFGATLTTERPMIERFARLQHPDLLPAEIDWCRLWTRVWTSFFAFNVVTIAGLALTAPIEWWVVYTGGIAYALMGMLFGGEYLLRKQRFARYDDHLLDRALARLFGASP